MANGTGVGKWYQTRVLQIPVWVWAGVLTIVVMTAVAAVMTSGVGSKPTVVSAPEVQQPSASASSADKPVAPQQAAASESAPSITAKGFSSGKYKLSTIKASSPNVVVALFGVARETPASPGNALKYTDRDALVVIKTRRFYPFGSFRPFTRLEELVRSSDDKSFLVIGSLRDPTNNKFLDPKDAVPDVDYLVSTLFADDFGDGNLYDVQEMVFLLYKTSSGEWRIRDFSFLEFISGNAWDGDALRRQLKKANNEPFNISE